MKIVYNFYYCGDDVGEVEGMFDENDKLLGTWCCNDGMWRNEYFNGFLQELGIDIQLTPTEKIETFERILKETWAPNYEDEEDEC